MEQVHVDRLNRLADHLDTVPVEQFDLQDWVGAANLGPDGFEIVAGCGTVACAVGHACLMPEFQDEGLKFDDDVPCYMTFDRNFYGWFAVEEFFGLAFDSADKMFSAGSYDDYATSSEVAARIRQFLDDNPIR